MSKSKKKLSNPFSTGGGGGHFEAHVQASFVVLMLTNGYAPCLPCWPIREIKLQGKIDGYETDDLIVQIERNDTKERRKLLGQVKHSISITKGDTVFSEVIDAAWSDFNNKKLFSNGRDVIALITGPLSAIDSNCVQWLLNHARYTKNADEFYRDVEQSNFSPPKSTEKLDAFKCHLKAANGNVDVSKDDLYSFLRSFHFLGYDLGKEHGVVLSLLHSHISQFNQKDARLIWARIVEFVQTCNQNAGTITLENLPDDVKEIFRQPNLTHIPAELAAPQADVGKTDWANYQHATELALAGLIGAWNENNGSDLAALNRVTDQDYHDLAPKIRESLQKQDSIFSLKNGIWKISDRSLAFEIFGPRIFDQNLDVFREVSIAVLSERDPSFDLPPEERYAAGIYGKSITHSPAIRKGIAEGLALIGIRPSILTRSSHGKAEAVPILAIREIFKNADWVTWGSLNSLLPVLAEAAPDEFLGAVENALHSEQCPFDVLFSEEGRGITGGNYLTGLLWGLEALAWDEKYLVRVCDILGALASRDPGGQWTNRPANSLSTILLPWLPQTIASIEKRKAAVRVLCREWPDIAWKLLIGLLPNQHQMSTGCYKPRWRNTIPADWEKGVTNKEYFDQVATYAEMALDLAAYDPIRLGELVGHFDNLPKNSFDKLLSRLESKEVSSLPEEDRQRLWNNLAKFTSKHRRFPDAKWALGDELISSIESVAEKLTPSNPQNLYKSLFTEREFDLYEERGNWEEQGNKLERRRQEAIRETMGTSGITSVVHLAEIVESPYRVGYSTGCISDAEVDKKLLPQYLASEDRRLSSFIGGYIWGRFSVGGWEWIDELDRDDWKTENIVQFLICLPFKKEAWERATQWLNNDSSMYWRRASVNPYQAKDDLGFAIEMLIEGGRPNAAIDCMTKLRFDNQNIDIGQCVRALLSAPSSEEDKRSIDAHHIIELIKTLQESPDVPPEDLFQVEWTYLQLLDRYNGASPKFLESRLAGDPEFFCEVIRLIYRSKDATPAEHKPSDQEKAIATNAWHLLNEWKTPPGTQADGSFDKASFLTWLQRVKEICTETGHLEVALINVGEVLIHAPSDREGLWIDCSVADALNARDAEDMRRGFHTGICNSRGAHWVDPTGKPEQDLAEQYQKKAEAVENAGYQRFAQTLRELSSSYLREAERVVAGHKRREDGDDE